MVLRDRTNLRPLPLPVHCAGRPLHHRLLSMRATKSPLVLRHPPQKKLKPKSARVNDELRAKVTVRKEMQLSRWIFEASTQQTNNRVCWNISQLFWLKLV